MSTYIFNAEQFLPVDMATAWDFFSSPQNLATITPPSLSFKIISNLDEGEIYPGQLIRYIVKPLFGIPLQWTTEITSVNKPFLFVDTQVKGPYKLWEHTHRFREHGKGILMEDEVRYQLPFGILGKAAHSLVVRKKLQEIFSFRKTVLSQIFREQ